MRQKVQLDQRASVGIGRRGEVVRPDLAIVLRDSEPMRYGVDDLAQDTQSFRMTSDQGGRNADRGQGDRAQQSSIESSQQTTELSTRHYAEDPSSERKTYPHELADAHLYSTNSRPDVKVARRGDLGYHQGSREVLVARRDSRSAPREIRYQHQDGSPNQSQRQQYPPRSVQADLYDLHLQEDTFITARDIALDTRGMATDSYGRLAGSNRTAPSSTDQSESQHKYTREDVERLVAKKLKELGCQQVRTEEFKAMVDREFQRLDNEGEQRSQISQQAHQQGAHESSQPTVVSHEQGRGTTDLPLDHDQASRTIIHQDTRTDADTRRQAPTQRPRDRQSDVQDRRTSRRETLRDPRNTDDHESEELSPARHYGSSRR